MEILLWLAPAAVVTTVAMLWAAWAGRESHRAIDPEQAAERLGRALRSGRPVRYAARPAPVAGDGGSVALRPLRDRCPADQPEPQPVVWPVPPEVAEGRRPSEPPARETAREATPAPDFNPERTRRAS
ncbi:MAG: hypothetical protein KDB63_14190 [Nocardioidaceae bacterium]|nr:hypothetical protein [Nocardioidaceae bacterium]